MKALGNVHELWRSGYTAFDIVNNLSKLIQYSSIDQKLQFEFLREIAALKIRILEGLNSFLQVTGFLGRITEIAQNKGKRVYK